MEERAFTGCFKVREGGFDGPAELLLELVQRRQVDLFEIRLAEIAAEFERHVHAFGGSLDFDGAGEFVWIAASLALMKSRLILPYTELQPEEDEGERDPDDPERLIAYRRIRSAAEYLEACPRLGRDFYRREPVPAPVAVDPDGRRPVDFEEVSVYQLVEAFSRVLKRFRYVRSYNVHIDDVSVEERLARIEELLMQAGEIEFDSLFGEADSRIMLVATFLAVLELARLHRIRILQRQRTLTLVRRLQAA